MGVRVLVGVDERSGVLVRAGLAVSGGRNVEVAGLTVKEAVNVAVVNALSGAAPIDSLDWQAVSPTPIIKIIPQSQVPVQAL